MCLWLPIPEAGEAVIRDGWCLGETPSLVSLAAAGGEQGRALRGPCTPQPGSPAPGLERLGYTHHLGVFPRYLPGRPTSVWEPVWGSYYVSGLHRALSADIVKPINGQGAEAAL